MNEGQKKTDFSPAAGSPDDGFPLSGGGRLFSGDWCGMVINSLTDPLVITDLSQKIVMVNEAAAEYFRRLMVSSPVGKQVLDVVPMIDKKTAAEDYDHVITTGEPIEREVTYDVAGRIMYSITKRIPMKADGEVVGLLLITRDVTKEKTAEKALRDSLDRFGYAARAAGEIVWESDMNGLITYISPLVEKVLGYKLDELVGKKRYASFLDPEGAEQTFRLIRSCYDTKTEFCRLTVGAMKKDGEKVKLELSGTPIFDDEGMAIGFMGIATDVTDRYAYEENLKKFQMAVENASDHIIITDPDGVILFANPAASKTTGYETKEIIGSKPSLWGKQMPTEFYKNMWHEIKDLKRTFIGELTNKRKNGELYIAEARLSPVLDINGNIEFFVGIERDITKIKEVDRAKTEFVSLASHQLRTPLSIINWYSEMILNGDKGPLTEGQREYALEIHKSNHRMIDLVNSLLNTSRIDMGTFMVSPAPVDFGKIADVALAELAPQIMKKGLVVTKDYDDVPVINADQNLVRIIFQNLLSNAVKYTSSGGRISAKMAIEGEDVLISISDTGCGIPERQKSKIFTKLFRADNAREIDPDGTGLGLYIVKAIVDISKGDIRFESKENEGTTFFVKLPLSGMKAREGVKGLS